MVDIAHHIDHFAGDGFARGCVETLFAVLVFFRECKRRESQSRAEADGYGHLQNAWSVCS